MRRKSEGKSALGATAAALCIVGATASGREQTQVPIQCTAASLKPQCTKSRFVLKPGIKSLFLSSPPSLAVATIMRNAAGALSLGPVHRSVLTIRCACVLRDRCDAC